MYNFTNCFQRTLHQLSLEGAEREVVLRAARCGQQEAEDRLLRERRVQGQHWKLRMALVVAVSLLNVAALLAIIIYV